MTFLKVFSTNAHPTLSSTGAPTYFINRATSFLRPIPGNLRASDNKSSTRKGWVDWPRRVGTAEITWCQMNATWVMLNLKFTAILSNRQSSISKTTPSSTHMRSHILKIWKVRSQSQSPDASTQSTPRNRLLHPNYSISAQEAFPPSKNTFHRSPRSSLLGPISRAPWSKKIGEKE